MVPQMNEFNIKRQDGPGKKPGNWNLDLSEFSLPVDPLSPEDIRTEHVSRLATHSFMCPHLMTVTHLVLPVYCSQMKWASFFLVFGCNVTSVIQE